MSIVNKINGGDYGSAKVVKDNTFTGTNTFTGSISASQVYIGDSNITHDSTTGKLQDGTQKLVYDYELLIKKNINETTGIIIPLYIYPADIYNNVDYNNVIDLKKQYHTVPLYTILNPSNGPGTVADGNYSVAIQRLVGAGALPLGYVSTNYTVRAIADVKADLDTWKTLYPEIQGAFFDEMDNTDSQATIDYYSELTLYARKAGYKITIGNPGANVPYSFFTNEIVDVIMTYETSGYPTEAYLKGDFDEGFADTHYKLRASIAYGVDFERSNIELLQKYSGMIYATDDVLPNPWDSIPSYLEDIFRVLSIGDRHSTTIYNSITTVIPLSAYNITDTDQLVFVNSISGDSGVYLPDAPTHDERMYTIKRIDASGYSCNVFALSGDSIDGDPSVSLASMDKLKVISNGSNWYDIT